MTQQNTDGQAQHVIASPNPTINESSAPGGSARVEATKVQPAQSATQAPMKTTAKPASKSKPRRAKPRND